MSGRDVPALVVRQWLTDWDRVDFDNAKQRAKPQPHFYIFGISARTLRRLSGIYRREAEQPRTKDFGIQRRHEGPRSREIARFVVGGLPLSSVTDIATARERFGDLLMPGWLPTAIVANILTPGTRRMGTRIKSTDVIRIKDESPQSATLVLPEQANSANWQPDVPPMEIIDGQHRLWAFDDLPELEDDYELPVVAFYGLDVTWQAYLFWTINIKPKRINASLAFDLYPLLRTQDWLERIEGPRVYREARAQELTEMLWSYPDSPWFHRINMLGDPGAGDVTQASFIRSLMASYVKTWEGPGIRIGGLFGGELKKSHRVLHWSRVQQAAFLILLWREVESASLQSREPWANHLKEVEGRTDAPFKGRYTLLATDQGVRAVMQVTNDLCYIRAEELKLGTWLTPDTEDDPTEERISKALDSAPPSIQEYLTRISNQLAGFDWRTSSTPGIEPELRLQQAAYRGSGGYRDLRHQLLLLIAAAGQPDLARPASTAIRLLGYRQR